MDMLADIEQACKDNNHESVKQGLDTIESHDLKKNAFQNIIDYYENVEAKFPVGYVILFIECLLKNRDYDTASSYIERLNKLGIPKERISGLIYEYVIKPDESSYENRFRQNLKLLVQNGVLFSKHTFDFHNIKKNITSLKNSHTYPEEFSDVLQEKKTSFLLIDLIDMEMIKQILKAKNYLYIVYDDLNKFYYMLLFEDMLPLSEYIKTIADEAENIILFAGRDMDIIRDFFINNALTLIPRYVVIQPEHKDYQDVMKAISDQRSVKLSSYNEALKAYYKNKDYGYYQNLFLKKPSDIKILIITSQRTTLNKYISRNWYDSFASMGYTVKIIIENKPYERMNEFYASEIMSEFKPDMIFGINFAASLFNKEHEIKDNLLYIMRYRDYNHINYGQYEYQNENIFILPLFWDFADALRKANVPENRIHYTVEGVDINLFKKSGTTTDKYACDVVSVNNAAGNGLSRLEHYLQVIENEVTNETIKKAIKKTMSGIYNQMQEMAFNDQFLTEEEFLKLIYEKNYDKGFTVTKIGRQFFTEFYSATINSFFRRRVLEWIVDSNITKNIKVWGMGWPNIENLKRYHMGVANHGSELSGIYESSKISLCDTWGWNTHERNYEILASGGFPLVKSLDPDVQEKMDNITNYFKENEEIVLFDFKDDLLNKIQYYLDNPEERERIAENGRNVVIQNFSTLAINRKTMEFIENYYSKRIQGVEGPGIQVK